MNTSQNLRPFPPGVSGNPGGRPKRKPVTLALEKMADTPLPKNILTPLKQRGFKGKTWAEATAFGMYVRAVRGDVQAAHEIADRLEGKAEASLKLSGALDVGEAIRGAHEAVLARRGVVSAADLSEQTA